MPVPPSGTLTFLFTDIEGSTRLWEQLPEAMTEALGAAHALRETSGMPTAPLEQAEHQRHIAAASAQLGEATFAAAWTAGVALTLEQAVEYALGSNS